MERIPVYKITDSRKINMIIHKTNGTWNYEYIKGWVGGKFPVSNLSNGYHGILKQWFNSKIDASKNSLLISENKIVKNQFQEKYPTIEFKTLEYYEEMNQDVDLKYNLCDPWEDISNLEKFDIILCQATFEHLYDPCTAIKNLEGLLNLNGTLLIHTHVPGMQYHPYPKDYLRVHPDWFIDVEKFAKQLLLTELVEVDVHIFSEYIKVEKNV